MSVARIRTVKPEFWTSAQVANCSPTARLLFIGLWNFSDDHGIHPADPKRVKMEIFPGDLFTAEDVSGWIRELISNELLTEYFVSGQRYWIVTGWKHQKIDKPSYKYPLPLVEDSTKDRRKLADYQPADSKGMEGNGKEVIPAPKNGAPNVWDLGVSLLTRSGMDESQARAFLGRQIKDFDEPSVLTVLGQATIKNPADPRSYIRATLQATAKKRTSVDIYTKANA